MISFIITLSYDPNGGSRNVHYMTWLRGGQPRKADQISGKTQAVFSLPDDQRDFRVTRRILHGYQVGEKGGAKQPKREADHSPPLTAEVEN
jgi:hypothetical protein